MSDNTPAATSGDAPTEKPFGWMKPDEITGLLGHAKRNKENRHYGRIYAQQYDPDMVPVARIERAPLDAYAAYVKSCQDRGILPCSRESFGSESIEREAAPAPQGLAKQFGYPAINPATASGDLPRPGAAPAVEQSADMAATIDTPEFRDMVRKEKLDFSRKTNEVSPEFIRFIDRAIAASRRTAGNAREPWAPYLVDRADGCKGHYAIGRWHPDGYQEVWSLTGHKWASASEAVLTLGEARSLLRGISIPTAAPAGQAGQVATFCPACERNVTEPCNSADCATPDATERAAAPAGRDTVKIMRDLLFWSENTICQHEETHRGGAIWEICDACGEKWADDEGGKPAATTPAPLQAAHDWLDGIAAEGASNP